MTDPHDRSGTRARGASERAPAPHGRPGWRSAAQALLRTRRAAPLNDRRRAHEPFPGYFERATCVSFQMDGLPLSADEFRTALARVQGGES